jgi:hypothetical protein
MGLPPTRRNENHPRRHPRESGGPFSVRNRMDSRFRGNDVIFGRVPRLRGGDPSPACGPPSADATGGGPKPFGRRRPVGFGPAFRSVRAGRPQGEGSRQFASEVDRVLRLSAT